MAVAQAFIVCVAERITEMKRSGPGWVMWHLLMWARKWKHAAGALQPVGFYERKVALWHGHSTTCRKLEISPIKLKAHGYSNTIMKLDLF